MSKVLIIGPDYLDSFARNIKSGLNDLSIESTIINPFGALFHPGSMSAYTKTGMVINEIIKRTSLFRRELIDKYISKQIANFDPILVISVWSNFQPNQIEQWRDLTPNAKWVFWYPDAIVNLGSHRVLISSYDHFFFKEPFIVEKLTATTNLSVHFLAQGCNPSIHKTENPRNDEELNYYTCDIAIAGNVYPYRTLIMQDLPQNIHLNYYGNKSQPIPKELNTFRNATKRGYVAGRTKAVAFKLAKINLNTMHYGEIRGVNVRLFEATACGGFVLSHSGPEISRYFEPGKEIVTFESTSDLKCAVEHYLHSEEERKKIAIAGQERSHKDHTFKIRLSELLRTCELNKMLPHESNENKHREKLI